MSTKGGTSKEPRKIPPKEDIVTRNKSAQHRKLRDINRSMKKMTDLLKSPIAKKNEAARNAKKTPKKVKQKIKLPVPIKDIKVEKIESDEYYPDKPKRMVDNKKIVLKPKHELTVVAKTNKRKSIPKKDVQSRLQPPERFTKSAMFSDMTMAEIIQYTEETQELDDEDLMEILTCPSPVWWEDPPNSDYIEDAIPAEIVNDILPHEYILKNIKKEKEDPPEKKPDSKNSEKIPIIKNKRGRPKKRIVVKEIEDDIPKFAIRKNDSNFQKKSKKLEDVLLNIKNKSLDQKSETKNVKKRRRPSKGTNRGKKRRLDVIETELTDKNKVFVQNEENITKDEIDNCNFLASGKDRHIKDPVTNEMQKNANVPEKMPTLTKKPVAISMVTLKTVSEETIDTSSVSSQNLDTISDTNIRFLTDDDDEKNSDAIDKDVADKMNKTDENHEGTNFFHKSIVYGDHKENVDNAIDTDKTEYVTVYKVISNSDDENKSKELPNNEKQEANEKIITQLNAFYKKCKNANRRRAKKTDYYQKLEEIDTNKKDLNGFDDIKNENDFFCVSCEPQSKRSGVNIKYCMKCSSIFDTNQCVYCFKKACDENAVFQCNKCDAKCCCQSKLERHGRCHDGGKLNCDSCQFTSDSCNKMKCHSLKRGNDLVKPWDHCYALKKISD